MDTNKRLTNICMGIPLDKFPNWTDNQFCEYLEKLPYLRKRQDTNFYFVFKREISANGYQHWQTYCEFNQQVYFRALCGDFRSHVTARKESQMQAINYVKKERTQAGPIYERGVPKKATQTRKNNKTTLLRTTNEELMKKVVRKIRNGKYYSFWAINREDPEFFESKKELLRNIWNSYHPTTKISTKGCRVIWCFGEARAGKSTWTDKFLRTNWKREEIVEIFPNNMTYNDRIIFKIENERGKVLVINEVDENFPKNNNLIAFIDKKAGLITEKSEIENNFELIIINSVLRPEEIFGYLGKRIAGQVLGRIFEPYIGCEVYEIKKNQPQLERILREKLVFSSEEFQEWYQPIIRKISQPDYSLITKD